MCPNWEASSTATTLVNKYEVEVKQAKRKYVESNLIKWFGILLVENIHETMACQVKVGLVLV